jgi:putative nucleotidyltransferase with HDIG domain
MTDRFGPVPHLVRRFLGSLSGSAPPPADEAWAEACCLPGEVALWRRLPVADRRHAIGVARRAAALLGGEAATDRAVLAAALLHDVGKVEAGLGTGERVYATVVGMTRRRGRAPGPGRGGDRQGRVWRYLHHDVLGARLLAGAGSDPLTVAWAAEHHRPPACWTVPAQVGDALKAADDD